MLYSYDEWCQSNNPIRVLPISHIVIQKKSQRNNFIFHTQDCQHLGVMRTQYDTCISTLLMAIENKKVALEEILMPIMFLLRHSIELGLKDNLKDIVSPADKKKMMKKGHKLVGLYNILTDGYLQNSIQTILNEKFKKETEEFLNRIEKLSNLINLLDTNSLNFRFPVGQIQFTKKTFIDSYELYITSDTFLTFGTGVLFEYGYLLPTNYDYELDL